MESQLQKSKSIASELENRLLSLETKVDLMKEEKSKLVAHNETLATENSEALANVSNRLSNAICHLERVETEKMLLDDKVSGLESEKANIERILSTAEQTAKDFECKLFQYEKEANEAKENTKQSLQRQQELEQQVEDWSAKVFNMDVVISALTIEIDGMRGEKSLCRQEELKMQLEESSSNSIELEAALSSLPAEIDDLQEENDKQFAANESLKPQIDAKDSLEKVKKERHLMEESHSHTVVSKAQTEKKESLHRQEELERQHGDSKTQSRESENLQHYIQSLESEYTNEIPNNRQKLMQSLRTREGISAKEDRSQQTIDLPGSRLECSEKGPQDRIYRVEAVELHELPTRLKDNEEDSFSLSSLVEESVDESLTQRMESNYTRGGNDVALKEVGRMNKEHTALLEGVDNNLDLSEVYIETTSAMELIAREIQQESQEYDGFEDTLQVDELRNLCRFLEHDRAEVARITNAMLELQRESHKAHLKAAIATAQRESMDRLRLSKQQTSQQMKSLYQALCIDCRKRIDTAA
jgi:hypothetical protein